MCGEAIKDAEMPKDQALMGGPWVNLNCRYEAFSDRLL